ncbi:MAG: thymidine phosphorylase [Egibacteraceae bacterium]
MSDQSRPVDLVARKRDGGELDPGELRFFVDGFLSGDVSEGQMGALLMAGVLNGFTDPEAVALTEILVQSGEVLDVSDLERPTVDKHSTGGVGDGTTLLVGPLLAAAGCAFVKLAGRGLGHTGGTLDKLESIPGMQVDLEPARLLEIVTETGLAVGAQSDRLVPADRALYALRDVTATVNSPALIAASVMSKKLAAGAGVIVLDIKCGDGAFMSERDQADRLANLCVQLGVEAGRRCVALISSMDQPLGRGIGNALEVREAVTLLSGPVKGRLATVAIELAGLGLVEARSESGASPSLSGAREELTELWESGAALERLQAMIAAQGGDPRVCEQPDQILPVAPRQREALTTAGGVVRALPARAIGELAAQLGAGRARKGDEVDPAVGIELAVEVGDELDAGDRLAVVHARDDDAAERAVHRLQEIIELGEPVETPEVILDRVFTG